MFAWTILSVNHFHLVSKEFLPDTQYTWTTDPLHTRYLKTRPNTTRGDGVLLFLHTDRSLCNTVADFFCRWLRAHFYESNVLIPFHYRTVTIFMYFCSVSWSHLKIFCGSSFSNLAQVFSRANAKFYICCLMTYQYCNISPPTELFYNNIYSSNDCFSERRIMY